MAVCKPTPAQVRAIITTDLTDDQLSVITDDAALMADACIAALSCELQTAILRWMTAHLIATMSSATTGGAGVMTSMSLGDASETYAKGQLGTSGLTTTTYGQSAIALDPNGCLASLGMRKTLWKVL